MSFSIGCRFIRGDEFLLQLSLPIHSPEAHGKTGEDRSRHADHEQNAVHVGFRLERVGFVCSLAIRAGCGQRFPKRQGPKGREYSDDKKKASNGCLHGNLLAQY